MNNITRFKNYNEGVSEIFGTVLLLAIAVIIFSSLIVHVIPGTPSKPTVPASQLVGRVADDGSVVIEHRGGDVLHLENTRVILHVEGVETETIIFDSLGHAYDHNGDPLVNIIRGGENEDGYELWEPEEFLVYTGFSSDLDSCRLHIAVIDTACNAVVISGAVQQGLFTEYPDNTNGKWGG